MTKQATIARGHPDLVAQWHPTLNGDLTPDIVTAGSNKKLWWRCENGHDWQARVNHRARGKGCPYCSGLLPIIGETDLATTHPKLAAQWHPTLNGKWTPDAVTAGSHRKPWWLCDDGHAWQAAIRSRAAGTGCPYCAGKRPIVDITDLATTHPDLATQWHPTLNGDITPDMVTSGATADRWWICVGGHVWKAPPVRRVRGSGCPDCWKANNRGPKSGSILSVVRPDLAAQWHPALNGGSTPDMVSVGSHTKPWWSCDHGHAWRARVDHRARGSDCPYCSGLLAIPGETDLATTHPDLAVQWHPTLNGDLTPDMVTARSNKRLWWRCDSGHDWQAQVASRTRGTGCPKCYRLTRTTAADATP